METCGDLDVGGATEQGCGARITPAQLHTMCCHRTFSVRATTFHDRLWVYHGRCPTDAELAAGKSPLHQDDGGVWRRAGPAACEGAPEAGRGSRIRRLRGGSGTRGRRRSGGGS